MTTHRFLLSTQISIPFANITDVTMSTSAFAETIRLQVNESDQSVDEVWRIDVVQQLQICGGGLPTDWLTAQFTLSSITLPTLMIPETPLLSSRLASRNTMRPIPMFLQSISNSSIPPHLVQTRQGDR